MTSYIHSPEFLAFLHLNAYQLRLEADLQRLKKGKKQQLFFFINRYKFADSNESALLVIGADSAWREFIQQQSSNPNFVLGLCGLSEENVLEMVLLQGKAKPVHIEKAFKKYALLKKLSLRFLQLDNLESDMSESIRALAALPLQSQNIFKSSLIDKIKEKSSSYLYLNPKDTESRKSAVSELQTLIQDWQESEEKDAQTAEALDILAENIAEQMLHIEEIENKKLEADLWLECQLLCHSDRYNMTLSELENMQRTCANLLGKLDGFPALKTKTQAISDNIGRQIETADYNPNSELMRPEALLKETKTQLDEQYFLAKTINCLEEILWRQDESGYTLEKRLRVLQNITTKEEAIAEKTNKLGELRKLAINAHYSAHLAYRHGTESRYTCESKQKILLLLIKNIDAEMARTTK